MRADGGSGFASNFRQGDGPETHHAASSLHTQRSFQQTSTHRRNAQTWYATRMVLLGFVLSQFS